MKRSFRMIFIMLIVLTCLVALCACKGKAEPLVEETAPTQVTTEEAAPAQEAPASSEEAAGEEEEAPPTGETTQSQEGGADATATQENAGGDGTEENAQGENALTGGGDDENGDGDAMEDYLSYLYRTNRKQYYEYRAEQGEIEILPLSFFDLTRKGELGCPIIEASAVMGDYTLFARSDSVASLRVEEGGKVILSSGGVSSETALWGDYDRDYEIITECEGEIFGVAPVGASKAKVTYFLVTEQGAFGIVFRKELNAAQIDAKPETIRVLLEEAPQGTTREENPAQPQETLTDGAEPNGTLPTSDSQEDEMQTEPPAEPATDRATERRTALAPISESGCYAFFESIGGVAEISGEVTVTEESEEYSLLFSEMS